MIIPLTPEGPNYDTGRSAIEQDAATAQFLHELLQTPFDRQASTSEYCGRLNWPAPGEAPELLRWPVQVWVTDTACITQHITFASSASARDCMAEAGRDLVISLLPTT